MRLAGFFAALAAAIIGAGTVAAQTSSQVYHVGVLAVGADPTDQSPLGAGLIRGFAQQGFVLGKNLALERRAAHGQLDHLPELVDELVASKVAVIVTAGYPAALAAKHSTLPVVVVQAGDPVEDGLVASFARPGGHVTGLSEIAAELSAKRLALLKEAMPNVHRVAMLWNVEDLGMSLRYKAAEARARSLGIDVESLGVRAPTGSTRHSRR
jgi:putative ABC transport system substrate-binding protein